MLIEDFEIKFIGVSLLCVGDSCAAIFGSKYGKYRILNRKSLIGFFSFNIGTFLFYFFLSYFTPIDLMLSLKISVVGSFLEFVTKTHDNLFIPVATIFIFVYHNS